MHLPDKPCHYAPVLCMGYTRRTHAQTPVGVCIGVVSILTAKKTTSSTVVKQECACMQGNMFCETGILLCIIIILGLHKNVATVYSCPQSS